MATLRRTGLAGVTVATMVLITACGGGHKATRKATSTTAPTTTTTTSTLVAQPASPPPQPSTPASGPGPTTTTPGNGPPPAANASPTTVAPAPTGAVQAALARLVAAYPAKTFVTSAIIHTGPATYVAVAHDVGSLTSLIDVYVYQGSKFVDVAANIGSHQDLEPVEPTTIRTGNVTGAAFPDFLVPLAAGDHDNGVLLSAVGGAWHLIGVSERTGAAASDELVEPNIVGNEVTQAVNDCSPSCSQGTYSVTTYLYNGQLGKLVATGPTIQTPTP
ncbi:MAG: hypothetical protein M3137_04965 [Actinomycetota bacterium]|nr:hypothetical protein [Actinomycetota bacterium]